MTISPLKSDTISAYQLTVKNVFNSLKQIKDFDEVVSRSIRLPDRKGYLVCVSELHADDDQVITLLTKWRGEATAYRDSFKPTFESTKNWLRKLLLDVPDRILFLVLDRHGHAIGHLGFANALNDQGLMEIDNVIRGVHNIESGIMSLSMQVLIEWANKTFLPQGIHLRTLEDNVHAIKFYENLNFTLTGKLPLRKIEKDGMIKYITRPEGDTNPPDKNYVCMQYNSLK
jgi:perosamine synthetase